MINLSISDISDDDIIPESSSVTFRPKVNFKVRHVKRQDKPSPNPSQLQRSEGKNIESVSENGKNENVDFLKKNQNYKEEDKEADDEIPSDIDMMDKGLESSKFTLKSRKVDNLLVVSSEEDEELQKPTTEYYFEKYGYQGKVLPNKGNQMNNTNLMDEIVSFENDEELVDPPVDMSISNPDHPLINKEITEALFTDLDDIDDSEADSIDKYDDSFQLGVGKDKTKILCTNSSYQLALSKFTSKIASLHQLKEKTDTEILHLTKEYEQVLSKQQEMINKAFKMPQSTTDSTES